MAKAHFARKCRGVRLAPRQEMSYNDSMVRFPGNKGGVCYGQMAA